MDESNFQLVTLAETVVKRESQPPSAAASPFKIVVDPVMRTRLRAALVQLIDHHDEALAEQFADNKLSLESYKEYIELFARSLKETMESREGVSYLLRSVGFDVPIAAINLQPELRWNKTAGVPDSGNA